MLEIAGVYYQKKNDKPLLLIVRNGDEYAVTEFLVDLDKIDWNPLPTERRELISLFSRVFYRCNKFPYPEFWLSRIQFAEHYKTE